MRPASAGSSYCASHASQGATKDAWTYGIGAVLGHMVAPGVGGAIAGAAASKFFSWLAESDGTRPPRVFVSFDFDNDQQLKHLLIGQTKRQNLPFSVVDGSLKEAAPEPRWKEAALREIRRCDVVVVLLGRYTHKAPGVLAEVAMARAEGKPIVQLIGSRAGAYTRVRGGGRILAWTQDNLSRLFGGF
ncbi:MAG: TIR domain-containing protein [Gammaproteobacteria bacterium]|nr:TIR domain-containing protein [Gammaproteobacteria bacterium]MBU0788155.1 TIR domain-containing protein [Gammaproteobacteria bacterium]MBU0815347.1 TIR domain-containing protein [Gammaproteobacteria bacterium]MBU1785545.1 TIR domain-containing protein [Gammaproteobacteria bacterium]